MPDTDFSTFLTELRRSHRMPAARYLHSALGGNGWSYRVAEERVDTVDDEPRWRLRARAEGDTPAGTTAFTIGDASLRWSARARTHDLDVTVLTPRSGSVVVAIGGDLEFTFPSIGLIPVGVVGQAEPSSGGHDPEPLDGVSGRIPSRLRERGRTTAATTATSARTPGPTRRSALSRDPVGHGAAAQPLTTSLPLGRSRLIIDELRRTTSLLPSLDVAGTVFRLGNSGLMAMFDSMSWTQVDGSDEVRMHGGRLVRDVRTLATSSSITGTDG